MACAYVESDGMKGKQFKFLINFLLSMHFENSI